MDGMQTAAGAPPAPSVDEAIPAVPAIRVFPASAADEGGATAGPQETRDELFAPYTRVVRHPAGRRFRHTGTIVHQGVLVAFAMDDQQRIFYACYDADRASAGAHRDADLWDAEPKELAFPDEIATTGFEVAGAFRFPRVSRTGATVPAEETLSSADLDPFLSSTARLTADAPVQVLSDGTSLFVFRQAVGADHLRMVFRPGPDGSHLPVVDGGVLVDRFLLVDGRLVGRLEVRYQRSRNRSLPASSKDTMDCRDLEGREFREPTQVLPLLRHVRDGRFAFLLLPTRSPEVERWQVFGWNAKSGMIDAFSLERSPDGLFETQGRRWYVCPQHPEVREPGAGRCPVDGKADLVPQPASPDAAQFCLRYDGRTTRLSADLGEPAAEFTHEFWFRTEAADAGLFCRVNEVKPVPDVRDRYIYLEGGRLGAAVWRRGGACDVVGQTDVNDGKWHHVAHVYQESGRQRLFVDGRLEAEAECGPAPAEAVPCVVAGWAPAGAERGQGRQDRFFAGEIDELRVWDRALDAGEITALLTHRLVGREPGLIAYWRFDEDGGDTVRDETDNGHDASVSGKVEWVDSTAPLGPHPGIRRGRLSFAGRSVAGGLAAVRYAQQEIVPTGYDQQPSPLKRGVRVLLVAGSASEDGGPAQLAALDFAVAADGTLAEPPERVVLPELSAPPGDDVPMPLLHLDRRGLSVRGGLLAFAPAAEDPASAPRLLDSADRPVNVYWRGPAGELDAAQYETLVERARRVVPTERRGEVALTARLAGPELHGARVKVTDDGEETLTVAFTGAAGGLEDETWRKVPRDPAGFAAVLNGARWERLEELGTLAEAAQGRVETVRLAKGLPADVPQGAAVLVGKARTRTRRAAARGTATLDVEPVAADEPTGAPVQRVAGYPRENAPAHLNGQGSRFFVADASGARGRVLPAVAEPPGGEPPVGPRWTAGPPSHALRLPRGTDVGVGMLRPPPQGIPFGDSLSLEAWIRPEAEQPEVARVLNHASGGPGFTLGLHTPRSALGLRGQPQQYARAAYDAALNPGEFTLTCWVRVDGDHYGGTGAAVSSCDDEHRGYRLHATADDHWEFAVGTGGGWAQVRSEPFRRGEWQHVAAVYRKESRELVLHAGGRRYRQTLGAAFVPNPAEVLRVGAGMGSTPGWFFHGRIDEVRLWDRALGDEELDDVLGRRLTGAELADPTRGPAACWRFAGREMKDYGRLGRNGAVVEGTSEPSWPAVFVGVGSRFVQHPLACGERWTHLAATFRQAHALSLNARGAGMDHVSCGTAAELNVTGDLTLEASVVVPDFAEHAPVVAKTEPDSPYAYLLYVERGTGRAVFSFHDGKGSATIRSATAIAAGRVVRLAAVRRKQKDGAWESLLFVDGVKAAGDTRKAAPSGGAAPLAVGRAWLEGAWRHFRGTVFDVRLWNVARDEGRLGRSPDPAESGLVGWWRCAEAEGASVRDEKGSNHGILHGGARVQCPDPAASPLVLYVDGVPRRSGPADPLDYGPPQLELGQRRVDATTRVERFAGELDEVRVWKTCRTAEEIRDNVYRDVLDQRERLIGCWDFERTGTAEVRDRSGYGHHLAVTQPLAALRCRTDRGRAVVPRAAFPERFGDLTWEVWLRADEAWTEKGFAFCWMGGFFTAYHAGTVEAGVWDRERRSMRPRSCSAPASGGAWHHVAGVVAGGMLTLYLDGEPQGGSVRVPPGIAGPGDGYVGWGVHDGHDAAFRGHLREVRLWSRARTHTEIRATRFRRLEGSEPGLLGYWPAETEEGGTTPDRSGRGNHARLEACEIVTILRPVGPDEGAGEVVVPSTAPVGRELPLVRNVLRPETPCRATGEVAPAVAEYGELELDPDGAPEGVVKRSYACVRDGRWQLVCGFRVGDLESEWVGQAQYNPQLVGFIEGAPPVPRENFDRPVEGASALTLAQGENTTDAFSTSSAWGVDASYATALGAMLDSESFAGFGVVTSIQKLKIKAGLKLKLDAGSDWMSGQTRTVARKLVRSERQELRWETGAEGPLPSNTGLALVRSETADVYALRLKHPDAARRALVAFRMRPNPDVEQDWNAILFRINPAYTRQGSLDGRGEERGPSYFRPLEASALRREILQERTRGRSLYAQFGMGGEEFFTGMAGGSVAGLMGASSLALMGPHTALLLGPAALGGALMMPIVGGVLNAATGTASIPEPEPRNLFNTYVWLAGGGLFSETEETTDAVEEVFAGEYRLSGMVGLKLGTEFAVAKVGLWSEMEALFGAHAKWTRRKTDKTETSFSMQVKVDVPTRNDSGAAVDAYRFTTFRLAPSDRHHADLLNRVVDRVWLESNDPNAVALRQALKTLSQPWRVLHRVSFVSRRVPRTGGTRLEQALRKLSIGSNYELVQRIEPYVRGKTADYDEFAEAVRDTVRRFLPALAAEEEVLDRIVQFMCLYLQVFPERVSTHALHA